MAFKLSIAMLIAMITMGGGFYWYYDDTQKRMMNLQQETASYKLSAEIAEDTILSLQRDVTAAIDELSNLNIEYARIRRQNEVLSDKLARHDLAVLGASKPGLVEGIINRASDKAGRCFEILSGDDLTERERNAESANEFNSECPWLWTGSDTN